MRDWRKLHSSIIASERLGGLSDAAFRLFVLLVVAQDDEGKYPWTPTKVRSLCVGTDWDSYGSDTVLSELSQSGVAVLRDGFVYLTNGPELNGTPTNSKLWPHVYKNDEIQQSNSISDTALSEYSHSTDRVLSPRIDKIRVEESRYIKKDFTEKFIEEIKTQYPSIDVDAELEKAKAHKRYAQIVDRQAYFKNWMKKVRPQKIGVTHGRFQQNSRKIRGSSAGYRGW